MEINLQCTVLTSCMLYNLQFIFSEFRDLELYVAIYSFYICQKLKNNKNINNKISVVVVFPYSFAEYFPKNFSIILTAVLFSFVDERKYRGKGYILKFVL